MGVPPQRKAERGSPAPNDNFVAAFGRMVLAELDFSLQSSK